MDDETGIARFAEERLADDERFMRVLMAVGERRAEAATETDIADMLGLAVGLLSDPEAYAEMGKWPEDEVMPPSHAGRVLADIAMKRAILRGHGPGALVDESGGKWQADPDNWDPPWRRCTGHEWVAWPCRDVRIIVATWDAHREYKKEWAPQ